MGIFYLIIILVGVYWQWWIPSPKVANDYPLVSSSTLKSFMDFPKTWSEYGAEGLGEYTVHTLWSYPMTFLSGLLANLGLSFILVERFLIMIPFLILGIWGMWKLGEHLKLLRSAKFVATLFYMTNTYILLVLDGGQLTIGLAYAFFPISFLAIKNSIYGRFKDKILAGLSIWILGSFDFRFIYILILLCLIYFVYELLFLKDKKSNWIRSWFKIILISGLIIVALNAYWIIPIVKAPLPVITYSNLTQTNFISFTNLGHSMLILAPHWFKNIFGVITPLRFELIFITVLAFLAPILKPKDKIVGFWLLVALVSIFLTKGTSEPFGEVYQWLYLNIPGFSLFRDSTKFFFLVGLSYVALIGISLHEILRIKALVNLKYFFIISISFYILLLIRPAWQGMMTGTLSSQPFEKEYSNLNKLIENDGKFSRIFWIPSIPPLGQIDANHPSVEAARLVQKRPFTIGTSGTYETFNFLREATYMGQIFDVAGIGYVVYPYLDARRDNLHPDNIKYYYTFSDQLSNLPWLSKISDSPIPLWKVKQHQDRFSLTPNVWMVIGSDSIYNKTTKNSQLNLSKNALIFVDEYPGLGSAIDQIPESKIVLNSKTLLDLAASFLKPTHLIFPAGQLDFDPDVTLGWWKREAADLIRWRDFLQTKYEIDNQDFDLGGGWAIGEGNLEFRIQNSELRKDRILLARVLESTRSGQLKFYQDDNLIGQIDTKKEGNNVRWFEVGQLPKDGEELEIKSLGDINVINTLAILDNNEWINYQDKAKKLQGRIVNFDEKNAQNDNSPTVTYQKINPTKYKVTVSNLAKPAFLIFSQNYDGLWKLDAQISLPVYSLLNGFKVDKNGQYTVEFEPQKYVFPGLIISGLTLIVLIFLLFKTRESK